MGLKSEPRPVALTAAGTDSGGGAGAVADVKTFEAHGVWATVAITAVTAQNTVGVQAVHDLPAAVVRAQLESVATDFNVAAFKTGMLASTEIVRVVAAAIRDLALPGPVVDPVLRSSAGQSLGGAGMAEAIVTHLLPLAAVVTPNLDEAAVLTGSDRITSAAAMEGAARALAGAGAAAVLVTGGHVDWVGGAPDCLLVRGQPDVVWLEGPRHPSPHTHGTGCVLSAAIAANIARGQDVEEACRRAKKFVTEAIAAASDLGLGHGVGPVAPGGRVGQ